MEPVIESPKPEVKTPKASSLVGKYIAFVEKSPAGRYSVESITGQSTHNGHVFEDLKKLGYKVKAVGFLPHEYVSKKGKNAGQTVRVEKWHPVEVEISK